jgi:hypothetical protein
MMKKIFILSTAFVAFGIVSKAQSTANLQVIHNCATPAAAVVDLYYFNGAIWSPVPAVADLGYREATGVFPVLAGVPNARVGIAGGSSTSVNDTLFSLALPTLTAGESYVGIAAGLVGNGTTPFNIFFSGLQTTAPAGQVAVKVFHGSTNAPAVAAFDVNNAVDPLIPSLAYGEFTSAYANLDTGATTLALTLSPDYNTMISGFDLATGAASGLGAVVFASGLTGPGGDFNLFAALPNGTVLPFTPSDLCRAQVIHNAADPALASVDVYVSVPLINLDIPFAQSFAYKTATPYLFLPVIPVPLAIKFTAPGGNPASPLATIPLTLATNTTYALIANGVASTAGGSFAHAVSVNGTAINFNLKVVNNAKVRSVTPGNVSITAVHHGVDAPAVDLNLNAAGTITTLAGNVSYNGAALLDAPGADIRLDVAVAGGAAVKAYTAPLSAFGNQALVVMASGFLTAADENVANLQAFGLFAVPITGGEFIPLPEINIAGIANGTVSTEKLDVYPNPAQSFVNVVIPAEMAENSSLMITDMSGKVLKSVNALNQNQNNGVYMLDVDQMPSGIYTIIITDGNSVFSSQLIKK